jgi:hypothetical protein
VPCICRKFLVYSDRDGEEEQITQITQTDLLYPVTSYILRGDKTQRIDDNTFVTISGERFKRKINGAVNGASRNRFASSASESCESGSRLIQVCRAT